MTEDFNWVQAHMESSIERAFDKLMAIVERDVEEANKIPALQKHGISFDTVRNSTGIVVRGSWREMTDQPYLVASLSIAVSSDHITIERRDTSGQGTSSIVTRKWDDAAQSGHLQMEVDGEIRVVELWEISKWALELHFFEQLQRVG